MPTLTTEQRNAGLAVINTVYQAIAEAGANGLPSGVLFSVLMGHMSIGTYQSLIALLKSSGLVTESHHVLYAKRGE